MCFIFFTWVQNTAVSAEMEFRTNKFFQDVDTKSDLKDDCSLNIWSYGGKHKETDLWRDTEPGKIQLNWDATQVQRGG